MSENKIIAICQSVGEFQTEKDGSMSYSGGEAYAVNLDTETKVIDFKQDLAETFGYNVDHMLIKYFLPGNKKTLIMISKDKDLKRMINFFADADQVDVFVMPHDGGTRAPNTSNTPASRSSRTTISEAVVLESSPVGTSQTDNDPNTNEKGEDISVIVTPPPAKRPPGKPGRRAKLKQAGSLELIRRQMQCSKCKGLGHNKKTCKEVVETHEASSTPEVLSIQMDEDMHKVTHE
ncbi:hypothetical protein L1987_08992 [Smallanthus sonchifolius]|uniref:Uncharacterized protein n=1 Tax=Smallanthus sonchifolius TaxID=185202 RepID=A0ACB9JLS2_9ASTR|nr:hypothetical protein L1987_08992 [Smallanthus sonchifolius]